MGQYTGQTMENTGQVLFQDDSPRWFLAAGANSIGPLTASDLYERILLHEITWAHYVWRKGLSVWTRLCDLEEFKAAAPGAPPAMPSSQLADAARRASQQSRALTGADQSKSAPPAALTAEGDPEREWYLYYNDAQFGPFTEAEIERLLRSGRINARVHAWTSGMEGWTRLHRIASFKTIVDEVGGAEETPPAIAATQSATSVASAKTVVDETPVRESVVREQRKAPRAPMTARLLMSDNREVFESLCRDVSTGGMQVLTSWKPERVGMRLKLNITPRGLAGAKDRKSSPLKPFVAEGLVVRLLEDGRGFSFRFEKLAPEARAAIEEFVKNELAFSGK